MPSLRVQLFQLEAHAHDVGLLVLDVQEAQPDRPGDQEVRVAIGDLRGARAGDVLETGRCMTKAYGCDTDVLDWWANRWQHA